MSDARFEDAGEQPLRLRAETRADLQVISALCQDAVFPASEMRWQRRRRRFVILLNRFRWEDRDRAARAGRRFERVRSLLVFDDVLRVASQGVDPRDRETVYSLLAIDFEPGADGTGRVVLTLAGDGTVALEVECLEARLRDVTRPYAAPSGRMPEHE